jgi:hypothetical protein
VQLPFTIGKRSDGQAYEEPQKGGDIVYRLKGAKARIVLSAQKPITEVTVEVLGRADVLRRRVELEVTGESKRAEVFFDLEDGDAGYRVRVVDRFGFANVELPRRTIRRETVPAPEVVLLPETGWRLGDSGEPEDWPETEGVPVTAVGRFQVRYKCSALYGLSRALVRYRVVRKGSEEPSGGTLTDEDFEQQFPYRLPLGATEGGGSLARQIEFYALPADGPGKLDGTAGGGYYVFRCAGIHDSKGETLKLQEGDRIQFAIQVFGRDEPNGRPGRSVVREKVIVSLKELEEWTTNKDNLMVRIKQLEDRQKASAAGAD